MVNLHLRLYCQPENQIMDSKKLIDNISKATDIDRESVSTLVAALGDILVKAAAESDAVAMPSFGTFEVKKRAERISMHPGNGKKMLIPPKLSLVFRPSAVLKQRIRRAEND